MSEKDITMENSFVKPLSKGFNAVIIGTGEEEYFSKWARSESAAKDEIKELAGQERAVVRMQFREKDGYKNWTKYDILGGGPDFRSPAKAEGEPASTKPPEGEEEIEIRLAG